MVSEATSSNAKSLENMSDAELDALDMESLLNLETNSNNDYIGKGELVTGTVVQIDNQYIYLNYGQKAEGRVLREEVEGEVNIHDQFNAIVIRPEGADGLSVLSIAEANKKIAWDRLRMEEDLSNMILEGKISHAVNGGYLVNISGLQFFLPGSQLGQMKIKDVSEVIGKVYDFKILKLDDRRRSGVLSRKQLLDDRRQEDWAKFIQKYKEHDVVQGNIKGITEYGAFVEVEGIKGLLHVSDMSWRKNARPKDIVKKGQDMTVKILSLDLENQRVAFGTKQLSEDPWSTFLESHKEGDQLKGRVTQLVTYGAFVEVAEGVEGLIHLSELSWSRRINHPKQVLNKGDEVEVSILKIDENEKRLSLSLKDVVENPWGKIAQQYQVGQILTGKVTKLTNFGAFVEISKDVEGLIHVNDLSWDEVGSPRKVVKEGDEVEFKIMEMVPEERKISCSIKHLSASPWDVLKQKYPPRTRIRGKVTGVVPFGVFIEIEEKVEGLVHISHISGKKSENIAESFQKGEEVDAVVLGVDAAKKRISLSIKDFEKQRERETIEKFMHEPGKSQRMTLGEMIKLDQE